MTQTTPQDTNEEIEKILAGLYQAGITAHASIPKKTGLGMVLAEPILIKEATQQIKQLIHDSNQRAAVEARIDERQHTWKLVNDIRYQNITLDFAKELSLERLSALEVEQQLKQNKSDGLSRKVE